MNNYVRGLRGMLEYFRAPRFCCNVECGTELPWQQRSNRFCSKRCAAIQVQRVRGNRPAREPRPCEACGEPTSNVRYCGTTCAQDDRRQRMDATIEANRGIGFTPSTLRRYLMRRHSACAICATSTWREQPVPLVMDHIDGDSTNDDLDNLRLICPNCDAQLPTYKSRNRGKGRAWRRERYHAGKSY